jgi:iron(III) transport system substrate-binding protein
VKLAWAGKALCLIAVGLTLSLIPAGCGGAKQQVRLYCAQDEEFTRHVFKTFTSRTGVEILSTFDTEADKSVSLYEKLVRESERPRGDVYWNNEILATIRLQRQGLLEPYASPSAEPYASFWKDDPRFASWHPSDDTWHAFAARARVLIVNTNRVRKPADRPRSLFDLTQPRWKGRVGMAKPQFGTTATQAACLFQVLGKDDAKKYYRDLLANGVRIVPGNKQVAEGVGREQPDFDVGITDTDDAIAELKAGHPVEIIFPDRDGSPKYPRMGTLFIPNTVAIVRGGPNPEGARQLVDYLLSAEVETQLAEADSRQIPLNPAVKAQLPKQIERPKHQGGGGTVKAMEVDFGQAADLWDEVQKFLEEYARPAANP